MNIKRIAAATTGALLMGAALGAAVEVDDLGNYPFYSGSEPNVKIVVGSQAQPSDAVAAANIAAMIGNLAYASESITVLGADALSCEGGAGDVSGLSGTYAVTTPGVNPNVAIQLKSYIGGYLDYDSKDDRIDDYVGTYQVMDDAGTTYARKITNYEAPALVNKIIVSDTSGAKTYTEEEAYYLYSQSTFDTTAKAVYGKQAKFGYEARFTNPIPVCTDVVPSLASCGDSYKTNLHRVKVKFLGEEWVILEMNNFLATGGVTSGSTQVKLSKEVAYKEFMQIGDTATAANGYTIKLDDISGFAQGSANAVPVSFTISDADGNEVDRATLSAGQTYDKNGVVINVRATFTGQGGSSYAQVSIGSQTLTLTSGQSVQIGSGSNTENNAWNVVIVGGGVSYGASFARIQLKKIATTSDLKKDDKVYFIENPKIMAFTYNGLEDLTLDTLAVSPSSSNTFPLTGTDSWSSTSQSIYVDSSLTSPFNFGSVSKDAFYVALGTAGGKTANGVVYYYDNGFYTPYISTTTSYKAQGNVSFATSAAITYAGSGTTGVTFSNNTNVTPGEIPTCASAVANGTVTAFTGTVAARSYSAFFNGGNPTTSSYVLSSFNNATTGIYINMTSLNGIACTSGSGNFTFAAANGTLTTGGLGATGVTYSNLINFVPYNYGSQTVYVKVYGDALDIATTGPSTFSGYYLQAPEFIDDTDTTASMGVWLFDVSTNGGGSNTPLFAATSGTPYLAYNGVASTYAAANLTGTAYESGFISNRGGTATISTGGITLNYATRLRYALYTLSAASSNATGNTADVSAGEGETVLDNSGYKVVVKSLSGSSSSSGGNVSGVDGLVPSSDQAFVVSKLDTSSSPLVVLDSQADETSNLIVVGGPMVNTVAASVLGGTAINPGDSMVKVVGNSVVVAGYTAQDTQDAANELIAWLSANADGLSR